MGVDNLLEHVQPKKESESIDLLEPSTKKQESNIYIGQ